MSTVESKSFNLQIIFDDRYQVDYYQRDYVWQENHMADLISDLSTAFLTSYKPEHAQNDSDKKYLEVLKYSPYFLGEIVVSTKDGINKIIDGQQRITSLTLLLIYIYRKYGNVKKFPSGFKTLIIKEKLGLNMYPIDIDWRTRYMDELLENGTFEVDETDKNKESLQNILDRYNDIANNWNVNINDDNIVFFANWLQEKVIFSKVWTDSEEFAYIIFETMNDRGCPLTNTEMLRSYLLAKINDDSYGTSTSDRINSMKTFDNILSRLNAIKKGCENDFFKNFFRAKFAEGDAQSVNKDSDYNKIGKEFHRWVMTNNERLNFISSKSFVDLINQIDYFSKVYEFVNKRINDCDYKDYLYVVINSYFKFTLQIQLIMATIQYNDDEKTINTKIKLISKFICNIITYRAWNQHNIGQSTMNETIFKYCTNFRNLSVDELKIAIKNELISSDFKMDGYPILNQTNKSRIRTILALITTIVARESEENENFILNGVNPINVEHITSDHFEWHKDEYSLETDFINSRNNIGDLLLLPETYNKGYNDKKYDEKIEYYYGQNILAKTLCKKQYEVGPKFLKFKNETKLNFEAYDKFGKNEINKRADLYKSIIEWEFKDLIM